MDSFKLHCITFYFNIIACHLKYAEVNYISPQCLKKKTTATLKVGWKCKMYQSILVIWILFYSVWRTFSPLRLIRKWNIIKHFRECDSQNLPVWARPNLFEIDYIAENWHKNKDSIMIEGHWSMKNGNYMITELRVLIVHSLFWWIIPPFPELLPVLALLSTALLLC